MAAGSSVALVFAVAAPPALADTASDPSPSWGTAKASNGRAQEIMAVVEVGGVAYFGGSFTTMVGPGGAGSANRSRLAAIDGPTGNLTSWNPRADKPVWAMQLSADHRSVYVGGDFSHIGGRSLSKLAKIDIATGAVDPLFHPAVRGRVRALTLDGDRLYVGGDFSSVSGQPRPKLAAVDATTGAVLPWTPPPLGGGRYVGHTGIPTPDASAGNVYAVAVIGTYVFAAGDFLDFAGQGGLVSFDSATGALAGPQYGPGRPIFALTSWGGRLFAAGGGPGGRAYAYDPTKPKPVWSAKFDGDAVGIAADADTVYVAGHYDYIVGKNSSCYQYCPGGPTRHHLAAFTASNGQLLGWNPTADTITGPKTITVGDGFVFVVGEFTRINGRAQPGFAVFADPPAAPTVP